MVTYLSEYDGHLSTKDVSINSDIYIQDSYAKKRTNLSKQADDLLKKIPEDDKSYKYIKQIAGKDDESIEKAKNPYNEKAIGPSPRSARGLLDSYKTNRDAMNGYVRDFVESNVHQLVAIENKGRQAIQQSK